MSAFEEYAQYYDLFYADKDYAAESAFVREVIDRHVAGTRSIIEFGCGTARHAIEFVRNGFAVLGIERSAEMIARAYERIQQLPADLRGRLAIQQGDATKFTTNTTYDAAIALFHVANYQTTNEALAGFLSAIRAALAPNGVALFDFWYGPAVLSAGPQVRIKRAEAGNLRVTRIAEPVQDVNRNLVDVNYTLLVAEANGLWVQELKETHSMRYLFLPEIAFLAGGAGLEIVEAGEWMTGKPLRVGTWAGYVVVRPVAP